MKYKAKIFFTTNVFSTKEIGSSGLISENYLKNLTHLWQQLDQISEFKTFNGRFPSEKEIKEKIEIYNPDILGCHLSHSISSKILKNSRIFAVCTSSAGYNHIQRTQEDDILITHTPGVLQETVADYTIAIIMANLRNLIDLHSYVWNNQWLPDHKWDLDQKLSSVITNKTLGIVGLGEIGKEVVKKLYPWGVKIQYYDIKRMKKFEKSFPLVEFKENMEDVFRESDIVSIHVPLNKHTKNLVTRDNLKLMKKNALLVNTARGGVLDLNALLELLEKKELQIHIAFDVYPTEPIDSKTLTRLKNIKREQPNIRMILFPHNASADANTRAKMAILFLEDIIKIIRSSSLEDLKETHIIPEHKEKLTEKKWRISDYWEKK
jgi:glyoxylate reductase